MTDKCSHADLTIRVVALEASLTAFKELSSEREKRYDLRADAQDKAVAVAMDGAKSALSKADAAVERRLEGLNELRSMANDQSLTFARDSEVKLKQSGTDKRIDDLRDLLQQNVARHGGLKDAWGYIVGAAGVIALGLAYFHK